MSVDNKRIRPYKLLQNGKNLNRNAVPVVKNLTGTAFRFESIHGFQACVVSIKWLWMWAVKQSDHYLHSPTAEPQCIVNPLIHINGRWRQR